MPATTDLRLSDRSFTLLGKEQPRYHHMLFSVGPHGGGVTFSASDGAIRVALQVQGKRPLDRGETEQVIAKLADAYNAWATACGGRWEPLTQGKCNRAECPEP
jgi:hypothetical protein